MGETQPKHVNNGVCIPRYSGGGVGCAALQSSPEGNGHAQLKARGRRKTDLRKCQEEPQNSAIGSSSTNSVFSPVL